MMRTRGERNGRFVRTASLALFAASAWFAVGNVFVLARAEQAQGKVVSNRKETVELKSGQAVQYFPEIQFADQAGRLHRIEARVGSQAPLTIGTPMIVLYPPGDPAAARVGGWYLWHLPAGLAGCGLVLLAVGGLLIASARTLQRLGVPMRT